MSIYVIGISDKLLDISFREIKNFFFPSQTYNCHELSKNIIVKKILILVYPVLLAVSGPGRCKINNGGCWHDSKDGHTFSACQVVILMISLIFYVLCLSHPSNRYRILFFFLRMLVTSNVSALLGLKVMVSNVKVRCACILSFVR